MHIIILSVWNVWIIAVSALEYTFPLPVDLSHPLDESTISFDQNFAFHLIDKDRQELQDGTFYSKNNFIGPEHGGTHLDAPFHFNKDGWKVGDIPLSNLIAPGIVYDVRDKVKENADFELLPEHLEEWEKKNGPLLNNVIALVNFGWSSRYANRTSYFGSKQSPYRFPGISEKAARWLVNSKKIWGVGVDTPSVDPGSSFTFPTHKILAYSNLFGLENIIFPSSDLPAKGFTLIVLPLKIREGSGAPCRIVAI